MHNNIMSFLRATYSFCIEKVLRLTEVLAHKKLSLHLCRKLNGRKVLIVGSGPSAEILRNLNIPPEYLILSANLAPNNLPSDRPLSVYITQSFAKAESKGAIDTILKIRNIETLLTNTKDINPYASKQDTLRIVFNPRDTSYSRPIPLTLTERHHLAQKGHHAFPSSGIQLLQYALSFGASEIYLVGIDSQEIVEYTKKASYPTKDTATPKINKHYFIDRKILHYNAQTQKNIYSITALSPISELFPIKALS